MRKSRNTLKDWGILAISTAALLIIVSLSSCGDSSGDQGGTQQLTHAQAVKQADAICARTSATASKELTARLKKVPQGVTPEVEEELILTVSVPAIEGMATDLAEIDAGPEDKQELKAISVAFTGAAAKIKENPVANIQNDPYTEASGLADAFGLTECSKY